MKRIICLVLAAALLLSLAACSSGDDPNIGYYECLTGRTGDGPEVVIDDIFSGGTWLELKAGGKATLSLDGSDGEVKWSVDGTEITVDIDGQECTGSISGGIIVLNMMDSDMVLTFVRPGVDYDLPESSGGSNGGSSTPSGEQTVFQQYWNGDWYGWWCMLNNTGDYEDMEGNWWDTCARIDIDENGEGTITIWDEDTTASNPLGVSVITITDNGGGEMGVMNAGEGWFLGEGGVFGAGAWSVDPTDFIYDNFFTIQAIHYEDDFGSFDCYVVLRPWGQDWSDLEADSPEDVPYFYYDWYLPLIENGEPMPDRIEPAWSDDGAAA